MKRWLPKFERCRWTGCADDGEAEGWSLSVFWLVFHVGFVLARETPRSWDLHR